MVVNKQSWILAWIECSSYTINVSALFNTNKTHLKLIEKADAFKLLEKKNENGGIPWKSTFCAADQ